MRDDVVAPFAILSIVIVALLVDYGSHYLLFYLQHGGVVLCPAN